MKIFALILIATTTLFGCSSHPILPEAKNVEVSREEPDKKCKELGIVIGTNQTAHGSPKDALENMKLDAARKGANYVQMQTSSAYGTTTQGIAYFCP